MSITNLKTFTPSFSNVSYNSFRIVTGTVDLPLSINYYSTSRIVITTITSNTTTPEVTTASNHGLVKGQSIFIVDSNSDATIDGTQTVLQIIDDLTFTISGVDTSVSAGTSGLIFNENYILKTVEIDSYDSVYNFPTYQGVLLRNYKFNVAEGRFEESTIEAVYNQTRINNLRLTTLVDPRFTAVNAISHQNGLSTTFGDVNNTGNVNWLTPATASVLNIESSSAADTSAGTGIQSIFLEGLDENFDILNELVVMDGITPVQTTGEFRALNSVALATAGSGLQAAGQIDVSSDADATIWATFLTGDTFAPTGRYTVPNNTQFLTRAVYFVGGTGGDYAARFFVQNLGGFAIAVGDVFINGNFLDYSGANWGLTDAGATLKIRAKRDAGAAADGDINVSFLGSIASPEVWTSMFPPPPPS